MRIWVLKTIDQSDYNDTGSLRLFTTQDKALNYFGCTFVDPTDAQIEELKDTGSLDLGDDYSVYLEEIEVDEE